jgi:polysaccharide export outer membrane protein
MRCPSARRRLRWHAFAAPLALAGLVLAPTACAGAGQFVWIADLPASALGEGNEYTIRDGDTLEIRVYGQDQLTTHARVRSDGRIAMLFVGDVEVRGKHPSALKAELEAHLKDYVNGPVVSVNVVESQLITVSVLGEVARAGVFPVDPRVTLAQVLALSGGLTDYATRDRIFVVRTVPAPMRVRFKYDDVSRGEARTAAFALHTGDLVVVE